MSKSQKGIAMNNYTSQAAQAGDALKSMAQILDKIAAEAPDVEICTVAYGVIDREREIHIYLGIEDVAELYGLTIEQKKRDCEQYPVEKTITIGGVKLFEIASAEKGNT